MAVVDAEAGDSGMAEELCAVLFGRARHGRGGPGRLRVDVGGDVEGAEDTVGEEGEAGARLFRVEQVAFDAPGEAVALLSFQVDEAFGGPGYLEAADRFGAGLAVELHACPELDGAARESGHGLGGVDLEDEAGRVGGRAAGLEERALVDDDDFAPAEFRQVVCDAAAGDAGADDYRAGAGWQGHGSF